MGGLCNADGSKIMTEDDGYETIVPDLSASEQAIAQHEGGRGEPVAWMYELEGEIWVQTEREPSFDIFDREPTETPLYAHPPATRPAALAGDRDIYEVANQLAGYIGPDTSDELTAFLWRESQHAAKLAIRITQQAEEVARLRRVVKGWADWYRLADGDPDCEYLNGKGWDDAEALADMSLAALRALKTTPAPAEATDEIARLRAEKERLREALRPFADAAEDLDESTPDRCSMWEHHVSIDVEAGDFRRARQALQEGSRHE